MRPGKTVVRKENYSRHINPNSSWGRITPASKRNSFYSEGKNRMRERSIDWHVHSETFGEEIANSVSHGAAFIAALAAAPVLIYVAAQRGAVDVFGASVFAASMVILYLASTLSHALPSNRAKRLFENLDQMAIYLLIAGTYTPFMLGVLRGPWGWTLLALVWGLAAVGITLHATGWLRSLSVQVGL